MLVCLADGYAAQGSNRRAMQFYERALNQSPRNKVALRGAARVAANTGATRAATELYERLLDVDPNNAQAKAYLAKHGSGGGGGSEPKPSEPEPSPSPGGDAGGD